MNSGLYVLLICLRERSHIHVGALGPSVCEAGVYAYVGSARRGLRRRIHRHFAPHKRPRWHADYLTTHSAVSPIGAVLVDANGLSECALNRCLGESLNATTPIARFGASDCTEGCPAHLWLIDRELTLPELEQALMPWAEEVVTAPSYADAANVANI